MKTDVFKSLAWDKPYTVFKAWDKISKQRVEELDEIFPVEDYSNCFIRQLDNWYNRPPCKGDILVLQGKPDTCKTKCVLSWATSRGINWFKAPSSLREWYGYNNQDLVIWDDMDENRKDLASQRMAQLRDHQVVLLDVKCKQGIQVRVPKMIITVNEDLIYEKTPSKFQARTILCKIEESLLKDEVTSNNQPVKDMTYRKKGMVINGVTTQLLDSDGNQVEHW